MCISCEAAKLGVVAIARHEGYTDSQFRAVQEDLKRIIYNNHSVSLTFASIMRRTDFDAPEIPAYEFTEPPPVRRP